MQVGEHPGRHDWVPQAVGRMLDAALGPALEPIRSEIFGPARFEQHGRSLAESHHAAPAVFGRATFYPRLQGNIQSLRLSYEHIASHAHSGLDISPGAEWLFDNFHLIEDQLREIREGLPARYYRSLPVLQDAPLQGLPRIYGLAWAFVAHTDGAFDDSLLVHFLNAYQDVHELSHGELWALPTTLRVVLVENLRRLADRIASHKAARELASLIAHRIDDLDLDTVRGLHAKAEQRGVSRVFLCHLAQNLAGHRPPAGGVFLNHIAPWLHDTVPDLATLQAQHSADQAADHLSVGNAVTALRLIGAADWAGIVARTSRVMQVMLASSVFAAEDDATRSTTLHRMERLAVQSQRSETDVAHALLALMEAGTDHQALAGHWLAGGGREALEEQLGLKRRARGLGRLVMRLARVPAYLTVMLAGSLGLVAAVYAMSAVPVEGWPGQAVAALVLLLMLLPASETVVAVVNRLISESARPAHLSRFLLADGLPAEARTLVVIPVLLGSTAAIAPLVHRLQLHFLANPEAHTQFALLSDFADADSPRLPTDDPILAEAVAQVSALNDSYPATPEAAPRFLLLHRGRTLSTTEGRWIGWERKRGKLEALLAALVNESMGPFMDLGELSRLAPGTRYVLTLDSDTQLPPGRLRALVGVALHPDNQPRLDASGRRVVQGYGILQPRVVPPLPDSSLTSPWQWMNAGQSGLDPYSAMSSDVYQDVFGEGSFTGKGLLHVATMHAVLGDRLPPDRVLSHDLIEGALARCAVVTDITLIEPDPEHADVAASRLHRWTRGDWQLLPFLLWPHRWQLSPINRLKLLDNLRRSLVTPASVLLVLLAMWGVGLSLGAALWLALAAQAAAPLMGALAGLVPHRADLFGERFARAAATDIARALLGGVWHGVQLLQQALRATDAVLRTGWRMAVSRRRLLAWTTADAASAALRPGLWPSLRRHALEPLVAVPLLALLWLGVPEPPALAVALLVLWALAPLLGWLAHRPWPGSGPRALAATERGQLGDLARDTWRYFERCVDARNRWLPPDNLQILPFDTVAHRTSPTNIGLYLLSTSCARELGWIGTQDLLQRMEATLASLQQMERHRGHFLNWYDTETLQPLLPRYVSTVDSGNLCVHLLAVAQACRLLSREPHATQATAQALQRSQERLAPALQQQTHWLETMLQRPLHQTALGQVLQAPLPDPLDAAAAAAFASLLDAAAQELSSVPHPRPDPHPGVMQPSLADKVARDHDSLHALLGDHLATLRSVGLDRSAAAEGGGPRATRRLLDLAAALEQLAWAPEFGFLYHPKRHLLHIGFRLDDQALDASFYDLLASESRSTSLLAIAKGDVPMKHWAALGRPLFAHGRHAVLRSWSGSMFEYLMPTLLMAEPHGSVLREAGCSALVEQIAHGHSRHLPWGISESAYAGRDHTLAYQYAPQGVPSLALRRTPLAEQVVAPYATALATQVNARLACQNLNQLANWSARGRFGFIEALDFTTARQKQGGICTPVATYMAHHQGMTIVALTNVLRDNVAQRWGIAHPNLEAVSSLLHERAPRALPALVQRHAPGLPLNGLQCRAQEHVRTVLPGEHALEPTHLMSNGRYSVSLRANGAGWSQWGATGITRWRDDALRDACGSFVYVRLDRSAAPVSVSSHPAPDPAARYLSTFHADRVVFEALWPELRVQTTVWVSPEDDIELKRVVLTNRSDTLIELELISAFDVTLARAAADEAHPAFSNFFIEADWLADQQALRFVRAPRLQTESTLQAAHFLSNVKGEVSSLRCQTDRSQWLGRNHSADLPLARMAEVPTTSQVLHTGLDPVAALGVGLRLAPGAQACVTFATAASDNAEQLLAIVDKYRQPSSVERASVMSSTLSSIQVAPGRSRIDDLPAFQALTTAMLMTLPKVDLPVPQGRARRACDRRSLWQLGISGDRPLLLVSAGSPQGLGLLRSVVQALREWSRAGVACDVVVLSSEAHSYQMPLQRELTLLAEQLHAGPTGGTAGGLHLLRPDALTTEQLSTLDALARIHLRADGRSWTAQITAWSERFDAARAPQGSDTTAHRIPTHAMASDTQPSVGAFEAGGRRFAFDVSSRLRPQRPWINVLANPGFGAIVSESGGGNTWAGNSRLNQLTAWSNDPVADTPGEWFLLQDRRTHAVWSLTPSSWGDAAAQYRVVHAQGRTSISHRRGELDMAVHWSVDPETAVKQVRIEIVNRGHQMAHLRTVAMVEWLMGEKRSDRATLHTSRCVIDAPDGLVGVMCTQTEASAGGGGGTAFLVEAQATPGTSEALDWTCDRAAFFDAQGQLCLPQHLGQRQGDGLDPCAALSRPVTVRPGATLEQVYLLGYAATPAAARELAVRAMKRVPHEREEAAKARWDALLGATTVTTPDPLFDALTNRWLLYQTVSSRLWAKAGFYQAGGATGYRDQLQDTMALTWAAPRLLRDQIVLCASRQFEEGDVQHWWHAPGGAGVRTHFSDDLLWLPFACAHYLKATGDATVLDESVPFLDGVTIAPGAEDAYDTPRVSEITASVFEHAARTIDRSLPVGEHGLPLMGSGDWNDGMNRVGFEGRGESVWVAWFLCAVVRDWIPLARERGEVDRAERWGAALAGWTTALETQAWDGDWYRRAFFDDGSPLGSHTQAEARIDLIAQAWSVLSGQAPLERQRQAMEAAEAQLVNAQAGLIQLLAPPLAHAQPSAGYIQAYPPGVRENGGQYSHAGVWGLMAVAALAVQEPADSPTRDTPYRHFTYLSPAHRSDSAQWGPAYGLEPYAMAADVYSQPPYVGRGGWSWYTGAAGWLHRAAIESIMGLKMTADHLSFTPCLPAHWPRAEVTLVRDGRTLRCVIVRQSEAAARADWEGKGVALLAVGERLAWAALAPHAVLVVALQEHTTG
jgi:cyclic beta-1,2-glucan synthetase